MPAMVNATDDILVIGTTIAESNQNVDSALKRLDEHGLTVNEAKCLFNQSDLTFFGFHFTEYGVSLNATKTKALNEFKIPNNASDLYSFLGLVVYASRWIKDLSTLTEPLWKMTHKDVKWELTPEHQTIFTQIKESLIKTIGYFDTTWDTQVTTDASPVGIFAVLTQSNPNNPQETKIIQCISRTLTATERKYSQIELEALAPVWAVERLNLYTLGRKFK